ncbi:DNA/RNA non-specific endonuclease [Halomonas urumqiensis]|uniref:Endonuclease n=1 Tax=Halomonas urumqiensis TaxID=1684789 RepID=A0A2N7UGQ9_9GAMM|nr:DNA/RNA non-specific endonuclease [Halomonas urumqiensis]PMR79646.1 endonuclease [Halomonas urumqiensis]PTB03123.1 DNA/RNA non-specific endonuclease [Halomonas urumqiensis]GHE20734.1 DNA/RNA non-specific endonuclease [Halomonas urumqiensis]
MTRRRTIPRWRRHGRRFGVTLLFVVVTSGLWYSQERRVRDQLVWMGVPEWQSLTPTSFHRVLRNEGFLVGWSDVRVNPLWVSYQLHEVDEPSAGPRPGFQRDWRTLWPVGTESYFGSGYDRGHLAPNYAIAAVHGREAQRQTFRMSNMTPQRPDLNRKLWQRLEEVVIDHFVPRFGVVQVITGPLFPETFADNVLNRVGFVEIPEAFYKIIVVPGESPMALAFIMPQQARGDEPLDDFLVPIDQVEARSGLDFFPRLPDEAAQALEGQVATQGWALEEVARLPSRF